MSSALRRLSMVLAVALLGQLLIVIAGDRSPLLASAHAAVFTTQIASGSGVYGDAAGPGGSGMVASSPHGASYVVATVKNSTYAFRVSTDAGATWSDVSSPAYSVAGFAISDSGTIYMVGASCNGCGANLFYRYSGGAWWGPRGFSGGPLRTIVTNGSVLLAVEKGTDKVYQSNDDGVTWVAKSALSNGCGNANTCQVALIGDYLHETFVSNSLVPGYARWRLSTGTAQPVTALPSLALSSRNFVVNAPGDAGHLLHVATYDNRLSMAQSVDSGADWTPETGDLVPTALGTAFGAQMNADGSVRVLGWTSSNGTVRINEAKRDLSAQGTWSSVTSLATLPGTGAWAWPVTHPDASVDPNLFVAILNGSVNDFYRISGSGDEVPEVVGDSFTSSGSLVLSNVSSVLDVQTSRSRTWQVALLKLADGRRVVIRSSDGSHWDRIQTPPVPNESANRIAISDQGDVLMATPSRSGSFNYSPTAVWRLRSGRWFGPTTYDRNSSNLQAQPGALFQAGNTWIGIEASGSKLSYSNDDGNTWKDVSGPGGYPQSAVPYVPYAVSGGVLHVVDQGAYDRRFALASMTSLGMVELKAPSGLAGFFTRPAVPGDVWVPSVNSSTGLLSLTRSTDNGASWSVVEPSSPLPLRGKFAVSADGRIYVVGTQTVTGGYGVYSASRSLTNSSWSTSTLLGSMPSVYPPTIYVTPSTSASPSTTPDAWALATPTAGGSNSLYYFPAAASGPIGPETWGGNSIMQLNHGCRSCGKPIDLDSGAQFEAQTDLSVPGRGADLKLGRTYDTRRKTISGRFGFGWNDSYDWQLTEDTSSTPSAGQVSIREGNGAVTTFLPDLTGGYTGPTRVLATLTGNRTDGWVLTIRQNLVYTFDPAGKLTSVKDRNGYTTALAYDSSGRPATVTDEAGRSLTFGYDSAGRVRTVVDPMQRTATYTYSTAGDLTDVQISSPDVTGTTANGGVRTWHFDYTDHLLTVMRDPRGKTVTTSYDTAGRAITQLDFAGSLTRFNYGTVDAQGVHTTTVTHAAGNVDTFTYRNGLVATETKGAGTADALTTRYTYDPVTSGVTSAVDNAGNETRTTYDSFGNTLTVRDPLARITAMTYNGFGEPLTVTDPTGVTTTNTYDSRGNLRTISQPVSTPATSFGPATSTTLTTQFTYGDPTHPGDVTATQDPGLKTTSFNYDAYGNRTKVTDPTGRVTTTTYNALGWVTSTTSPAGNVADATAAVKAAHTTAYGDFTITGQPRTVDGPLADDTTTTGYDANGNVTDVIDAENRHTHTAYDGENRALTVTLNGATTSDVDYDANGNLRHSRDGAGHETTYTYDAINRLTDVDDPLHHGTHYGYDQAGRRATVTTDKGNATVTTYDAAGQATAVRDPENRTTTYAYDKAGRLTTTTDQTGRVAATVYDSSGRTVATRAGHMSGTTAVLTTTAEWAYDSNGKVLTSRDGTGKDTTYTYDDAGRILTSRDPVGRITGYDYDTDGNQNTVTRPAPSGTGSVTTARTYDAAGQLTAVDYPAGTPDVSYGYDSAGRRTSMTDGTGTTTYTYNDRGQLTGTLHSDGTTVGYSYDDAGRQTTITYPGNHTLTRDYDAAGHLRTVTDWTGRTTTYTWNTDDTLATIALPNGVTTAYDYDKADLTTAITTDRTLSGGSTTPVMHLGYGYDQAALLHTATDTSDPAASVTQAFAWDDRARLDNVSGGPAAGDYDFDAANHLTNQTGAGYTVDDAGQLTSSTSPAQDTSPATASTYTYDTHGNRTAATTTPTGGTPATSSYAYDAADRLTRYTGPANTVTDHTYDGDGLRAHSTTAGVTTDYIWDTSGDLPLLIADAQNWYLYGADGHPVAQINRTSGDISYLHADLNGSTRATTDETGTRTATWDYTPYGTVTAHTGADPTPFLYAGEYRDTPTGLYYLRARYYDPSTAAFLTRDPLEATTALPYGYTEGNPLQYADPTGLCGAEAWVKSLFGGSECMFEDSSASARNPAEAAVAAFRSGSDNLVNGAISGFNKIWMGLIDTPIDQSDPYSCAGGLIGEKYKDTILGMAFLGGPGGTGAAAAGRAAPAARGVPALRQAYMEEVAGLSGRATSMREAGASSEDIARALHAERRALGVKYKNLTPPDELARIYARNKEKYGDPLGPSIDYLINRGKSWDDIIESAMRTGGKDLGY